MKLLLIRVVVILLGIALLIGSITFGANIKRQFDEGVLKAFALDGPLAGGGGDTNLCTSALVPNYTIDKRVMSDGETQLLKVSILNKNKAAECDAQVSLQALEFETSPSASDQTLAVPPQKTVTAIWVLSPKKLGTFSVNAAVQTPSLGASRFKSIFLGGVSLGITVTNVFGLNIWQAQLASYLGTFLGTFLGPIFTFTWWYDWWKKHKRKKAPESSLIPQSPTPVSRPSYCSKCGHTLPTNALYCVNCGNKIW